MAFHWRCYKFICHNLLYAPLLAYLYMPSRGHTHRFSRSLPPSFLLPREPTELWLSRGDGGKGRGARQPAYKTPNAAPSLPLPPQFFEPRSRSRDTRANPSSQNPEENSCHARIFVTGNVGEAILELWRGRNSWENSKGGGGASEGSGAKSRRV